MNTKLNKQRIFFSLNQSGEMMGILIVKVRSNSHLLEDTQKPRPLIDNKS